MFKKKRWLVEEIDEMFLPVSPIKLTYCFWKLSTEVLDLDFVKKTWENILGSGFNFQSKWSDVFKMVF